MSPDMAAIVVSRTDGPERVREAIAAVRKVAAGVELWLLGGDPDRFRALPADVILTLEDSGDPVAERYPAALAALMAERSCRLLLACAGVFANELAVRLAYAVGAGCATSITGISPHGDGIAIVRREFGMQIEAELLYESRPCVFTVAKDSFDPAMETGDPAIVSCPIVLPGNPDWYENYTETENEEAEDLSSYDMVLAGGRGLGGSEAARRLDRLGGELRAGVGATRPVVLNAWLPMNRMIGVSGSSVKPKICMTFGVSGCVPFLKGIEKSGLVIAVNSDPDALIFRHCDIGLVADCNQVVDRLLGKCAPGAKGSGHD